MHLEGAVGAIATREVGRTDLLLIRDTLLASNGPGAAHGFCTAVGSLWTWAIDYQWEVHSGATGEVASDPTWAL
jgi:hypothetical protein